MKTCYKCKYYGNVTYYYCYERLNKILSVTSWHFQPTLALIQTMLTISGQWYLSLKSIDVDGSHMFYLKILYSFKVLCKIPVVTLPIPSKVFIE